MKSVIVSIGDELVLGQTVDTNSAWLSQQLAAIGWAVPAHITVADDQAEIESAIRHYAPLCDVMLITGGLGPTEDDLTRQALAAVLQQPLEMNDSWLSKLEEFFRIRNRPMVPSNRIQAMLPCGCTMIDNTCGTACGMSAKLGNCSIHVMPGVPREMKVMFERDILPQMAQSAGGAVILSRTLHTFGLGESQIGERLGDLMNRRRNPSVGTTVSGGVVSLRLNARFGNRQLAQEKLDETDALCREKLGHLIYGADGLTLPMAVADSLKAAGKTVTAAESCTGGLLAGMLTEVPGSSNYFKQGFITYSDEVKQSMLGVSRDTLAKHGAVSEPTVKEMAENARRISGADFALSISGIAGPDGGTATKPVGTVCFGLAHAGGTLARTVVHLGDRELVRDRSCKTALTMLRYHLLNQPLPF